MRLVIIALAILMLLSVAAAHEEDGHGHHHEPHHWESAEMRHNILAQLGGMVVLGAAAGSYLLIRRRVNA
jgi:Spy/CpxP family protein refolding chaperone